MRFAVALLVIAMTASAALYVHQRDVMTVVNGGTNTTTTGSPYAVNRSPYAKSGHGSAYDQGSQYGRGFFVEMVTSRSHPSWEDPVAVLLGVGGVALAVGIVAVRRRRTPLA